MKAMRRMWRAVLRTCWFLALGFLQRAVLPGRPRRVLFLCQNPLMAQHLKPYWELLRKDDRLSCRVYYEREPWVYPQSELDRMKRLLVPRSCRAWIAALSAPHLVITADHSRITRFFHPARSPVVFVGHGAQGKVLPGHSAPYAYTDRARVRGRLPYALMFEENDAIRSLVIAEQPELAPVIKVVGSIQHDELIAEQASRAVYRERLKIGAADVAVLILTTWGPTSLLNVLGADLLQEAVRLSKKFAFMLALHPHEYRLQADGAEGWGLRLRAAAGIPFPIRDPAESWIPYMVAADIVLSDYTSLVQAAVLLAKPIVVTPVSRALMMKGSVTDQVFAFAPVLHQARDLETVLDQARTAYPMSQLHRLAAWMHPHAGQALENAAREIYFLLKVPSLVHTGSGRPAV